MASFLSIGIDIGTGQTKLIISRITVENTAGAWKNPDVNITQKEIIYSSPIYFTPLKEPSRIDLTQLKAILSQI